MRKSKKKNLMFFAVQLDETQHVMDIPSRNFYVILLNYWRKQHELSQISTAFSRGNSRTFFFFFDFILSIVKLGEEVLLKYIVRRSFRRSFSSLYALEKNIQQLEDER